jgi:hypothetical protein
LHIFFEIGDDGYLVFFAGPGISKEENFARNDSFDIHLALEPPTAWKPYLPGKNNNEAGKTGLGRVDHGFAHLVYVYNPNDIQIELTCRASDPSIMQQHTDDARGKKTLSAQQKMIRGDANQILTARASELAASIRTFRAGLFLAATICRINRVRQRQHHADARRDK